MKTVLIATQQTDPHADAVLQELENLGARVLRLNTENLLTNYRINLDVRPGSQSVGSIKDAMGREVALHELTAAYYRKPIEVLPHPDLIDQGARQFAIDEAEAALQFVYTFPGLKWVNDPFVNRRTQVKFGQLDTAQRCGLNIPPTIVTTDPTEARNFAGRFDDRVLCKSLKTNAVVVADQVLHTFSHRLSRENLEENIEAVRYAPTLFQQYITKDIELRVNVIGTRVLATAIHSQAHTETSMDWRKTNPWNLKHEPYNLPHNLERAILKLVQAYGLHFAALDLIKTPTGEYVFLEINPNGQWFWIQQITGQPIARHIAEYLLSI